MSDWKKTAVAGYSIASIIHNTLNPNPNELNNMINTAQDQRDIRNEQMLQQQSRDVEVASRQRASRTEQTR